MDGYGNARELDRPTAATPRSTHGLALDTLATAVPGPAQRRFATGCCIAFALATSAALPVVGRPMPVMPGFLLLNQTALVVIYALTACVFYSQFAQTRALSILVLAAGSLFTTSMVALQLLCFPNVVVPGLLLGEGASTLSWLWNFWHLGPPLFALPYALIEGRRTPRLVAPSRVAAWAWGSGVAVAAAAGLIGFLVCAKVGLLPAVADADGGYRALTSSGIGPALIVLTIASLAVLCWRTRLRSVLQLWLAVSLLLLVLDNVVTDLGAARATWGWYVGRLQALLAGVIVLAAYLYGVSDLYRRAEIAAAEREQARADAQSARDSLEIALEASGMGDWELDLATDTAHRTLRHDRLFGYSERQARWGRAMFMKHVHPDDRAEVEAAFGRALRQGTMRIECRIRRADTGEVRWIAIHGRTALDAAGRPATLAGCIMDVTERRGTEERLREGTRMEAIGQLTGGVAHDFNNLLTVMLGSLDLIARKPGDPARVERLARAALGAGKRGTDLTDKLLAFSRRQMVQPETLNANRLLTEFRPLLDHALGDRIELSLDLDPGLDPVRLDARQFQAVLLNLAANARDAMDGTGRLRIRTRNTVLRPEEIADMPGLRAGRHLHVSIRDDGPGMDATTLARAFEPFFTTKEIGKGTGLGLSQVYGFARQAGGFCRIRSAPGQGCTIDLFLPRSDEVSSSLAEPPAFPLQRSRGGEVVLVVEDEEAVLEMAAESLRALDYRVLTAIHARAALDILRGAARVDILFSDVVMPGGMNGAQLAFEARALRPELKVLLTSGYSLTAGGGARDLPEGVPLLQKPYLREDLAAKIQAVMAA